MNNMVKIVLVIIFIGITSTVYAKDFKRGDAVCSTDNGNKWCGFVLDDPGDENIEVAIQNVTLRKKANFFGSPSSIKGPCTGNVILYHGNSDKKVWLSRYCLDYYR